MQSPNVLLNYRLLGPGLCMVASSYGLARYTYGLFIPVFRETLQVSDASLAFIAAVSYASYFVATLIGIALLRRIPPRTAVLAGGLFATLGMLCIACADSGASLALGVVLAGISPGLAWTPFSDIVAQHVAAPLQRRIYAIINTGTSLGVLMGGPIALLCGTRWRLAWAFFAAFGLFSTLWCAWLIPKGAVPQPQVPGAANGLLAVAASGQRLLLLAFAIGLATSVYWTFAVDLVARGAGTAGLGLDARQTSQLFWTLVGVAGLGGMVAGGLVERLGTEPALRVFMLALALATLVLAQSQALGWVLVSGLVFGASFVMASAALGLWSMERFRGHVSTGFGLTYLALSLGQFVGPVLMGLVIAYTDLASLFVASALLALGIAACLRGRGLAA